MYFGEREFLGLFLSLVNQSDCNFFGIALNANFGAMKIQKKSIKQTA